jgi:hypothetical protein
MKTNIKTTLALVFALISTSSNAGLNQSEFNWQEYKQSLDDSYGIKQQSRVSIDEKMKERYGASTNRESINDIINKRYQSSLSIGLEYQIHPTYEVAITVPDPTNLVLPFKNVIEQRSLSGVAITVSGTMDLSPIGITMSGLSSKVSISNQVIDMVLYKRLIGESNSTIALDIGGGVKTVISENDVYEKGFHFMGSGAVTLNAMGVVTKAGANVLFSKPSIYSTKKTERLIPFFSVGTNF